MKWCKSRVLRTQKAATRWRLSRTANLRRAAAVRPLLAAGVHGTYGPVRDSAAPLDPRLTRQNLVQQPMNDRKSGSCSSASGICCDRKRWGSDVTDECSTRPLTIPQHTLLRSAMLHCAVPMMPGMRPCSLLTVNRLSCSSCQTTCSRVMPSTGSWRVKTLVRASVRRRAAKL